MDVAAETDVGRAVSISLDRSDVLVHKNVSDDSAEVEAELSYISAVLRRGIKLKVIGMELAVVSYCLGNLG